MVRSNNLKRAESADKDMISSLPDCLIHHIMSFLTAYEAVRMCILSKRWKNLWTTLPVLDFDLDNFEDNMREWYDSELEDDEHERDYCRMFRDFVNMTILLRKATDLLKFRRSCSNMRNFRYKEFVRSWIRYALEKNPQVLNISISIEGSLHVGIFSCTSLVDLSLYCSYGDGDQISVVNLPCLRRLHLNQIHINQNFMNKLLCGCPVLELLHLMFCNIEVSSIRSQSLKYLTIENHCGHLGGRTEIVMELINAPNLLGFYYSDCGQYIGHKMFLNMPSLTSAIIFRESCHAHLSDNVKSKILNGLSSVRSLKLGGFWMKGLLENELQNLPKFQNVKDLSMRDLCLCCNFNLLASFLEHFPNLEILSIWHGFLHEVEVHGNQELLEIAPLKCKRLHTVNVNHYYNRNKNFHRVLKYLQDGTQNLTAKINMNYWARCPSMIWRNEFL